MQDFTYAKLSASNAILAETPDRQIIVTHQSGYIIRWCRDGHEYLPQSSLKVEQLNLETDELQQLAKDFLILY